MLKALLEERIRVPTHFVCEIDSNHVGTMRKAHIVKESNALLDLIREGTNTVCNFIVLVSNVLK